MPAIAQIGQVIRVTPGNEVQVVLSPDKDVFIDDRTSFLFIVEGILRENGKIIGVHGAIRNGPDRYTGLTVSLTVRFDHSDWNTDTATYANFKIGPTVVRRIPGYPYQHPSGTKIDGYPWMIRHGEAEIVTESIGLRSVSPS